MDITATGVALVPVVIGVVEVIKRAAGLADRYAPAAALLLAELGIVGLGMSGAITPAPNLGAELFAGAVVGLTACGLYAGGKTAVQG